MNPHWMEIHDLCVVWMTAVIWLVQLLLYPNFRDIPEGSFRAYHKRHCDRIALLVAPLFLQALAAGMVLAEGNRSIEWIFQAAAITGNIILTGVVFAPLHRRLENGKSARLIRRLIARNWVRTLLWSGQCVVILLRRTTEFLPSGAWAF